MDELRPPSFEPLAAPEGAFEAVVRKAKVRRWRRASGVLAAVVALGLAGTTLASDGTDERVAVADDPTTTTSTERARTTSSTTTTVEPTTTTTPTTSPVPTTSPPSSTTSTTSTTEFTGDGRAPEELEQWMHRGRVVDPEGNPLAGIYVYQLTTNSNSVGMTEADGTFEVPCGRWGLLLWANGPSISDPGAPDRNWAAEALGSSNEVPPCVPDGGEVSQITLQPGGTATGVVRHADGSPRAHLPASVTSSLSFVDGSPSVIAASKVGATDATGRYWVYGLTPGPARVSNNYTDPISVEIVAGELLLVDWGTPDGRLSPIHPGTPP